MKANYGKKTDGIHDVSKRLFDFCAALILAVATAPLMLLAAASIKLTSRGPVLYMANRVGQHGRIFRMHKFRTMNVSEPSEMGSAITSGADDRVFLIGRILRKSKIDELPQLWDILRGEMSFVGPRPEDPGIVNSYYLPEWFRSLECKPGLTSPGSLYYYSCNEALIPSCDSEKYYIEYLLPTKMALDLYYIDNRNLLYDVSLCVRTVAVILTYILRRGQVGAPKEIEYVNLAGR